MHKVVEVQPQPSVYPSWSIPGEWDYGDGAGRALSPNAAHPSPWDSPMDEWEYLDMVGDVQGPFSSNAMCSWFVHGMLPRNLLVRPSTGTFLPVRVYFPGDMVPFSSMPVLSPREIRGGAAFMAFDAKLLPVDAC